MGDSAETRIIRKFNELLDELEQLKPNDRSRLDRYWAITITEVEKAAAIFHTYVDVPDQTVIAP